MTVTIPEIQMNWRAWVWIGIAAWYLAVGIWMRLSGDGARTRREWNESYEKYETTPFAGGSIVFGWWLLSPLIVPFKVLTWLLTGSEKKGTST